MLSVVLMRCLINPELKQCIAQSQMFGNICIDTEAGHLDCSLLKLYTFTHFVIFCPFLGMRKIHLKIGMVLLMSDCPADSVA